jgi:hypothetical protein
MEKSLQQLSIELYKNDSTITVKEYRKAFLERRKALEALKRTDDTSGDS